MTNQDIQNRVAFFEYFASTEFHLALEKEAGDGVLHPASFDTSDGIFALAFDSEEAMADFTGGGAHATLPGRVLAAILAPKGIGICLDPEHDPTLLVPSDLEWLVEALARPPIPVQSEIRNLQKLDEIPDALLAGIKRRVSPAPGLATHAILAASGDVPVIAIIGAKAQSQAALAGSFQEALTFSGDPREWSIAFLNPTRDIAKRFQETGLVIPFPEIETGSTDTRPAPGSDPDNPPILR